MSSQRLCGLFQRFRNCVLAGTVVLLALVACHRPARPDGRTYGGAADDFGYSVQPTSDGGYVIAGATASSGAGDKDAYLIKTDAQGNLQWSKTCGGPGDDEGNSVQQMSDGGYVVAGVTNSFGAGNFDAYLIRTNAAGDTLWTRTFGGTGEDRANSVLVLADGFAIAGATFIYGPQVYDAWLIRTDTAGHELWSRTYGGTNDDKFNSLCASPDGGFVLAGFTASYGAGNYDLHLVKTDATGDTLWTRTFGGALSDQGWSVVPTLDGGYVAAGYAISFGSGNPQVYLVKVTASGESLWTRTYGTGGWAMSVAPASDSGCIVAGTSAVGGAYVYVVRVGPSGDTLWTRTFGGTNDNKGYSVRPTQDGGWIVAGTTKSYGAGGYDVYLLKTDDQGTSEFKE